MKAFGGLMIGIGKDAPEAINVFIEIPAGSSVKYEYDASTGLLKVDRFLFTSMVYPFNYGYIPATIDEDGDPLDALVISESVVPGTYIEAVPIGALIMEDENGKDYKIVAVPKEKVDPVNGKLKDISELPEYTKKRIEHFFSRYKELEPGKWVKVSGWEGKEKAKEIINKCIKR
ncbi:MAG: inorganic diphosphatase [Candidatus Micrarchaeaceae archaeon]